MLTKRRACSCSIYPGRTRQTLLFEEHGDERRRAFVDAIEEVAARYGQSGAFLAAQGSVVPGIGNAKAGPPATRPVGRSYPLLLNFFDNKTIEQNESAHQKIQLGSLCCERISLWRGNGEARLPQVGKRGVYGSKRILKTGSQNNFPNHYPVQAQTVAKEMQFTMMVSISWETMVDPLFRSHRCLRSVA